MEKREFDPNLQHPLVELGRHVASPLSAGLFIISLQKMWQLPLLKDYMFAKRTVWKARFKGWWCGMNRNRGDFCQRQKVDSETGELVGLKRLRRFRSQRNLTSTTTSGNDKFSSKLPFLLPLPSGFPEQWLKPRLSEEQLANQLSELYVEKDIHHVMDHLIDFPTVNFVENALCYIHDGSGLSWAALIMGWTFGLRMVLLPGFVGLLRNAVRLKVAGEEIVHMKAKLIRKKSKTLSDDPLLDKEAEDLEKSQKLLGILAKHKCGLVGDFLFAATLPPVILSVYCGVHNILLVEPSCAMEGLAWFPNLALADKSCLLPILSNTSWLVLAELSAGVYYHWWPNAHLPIRYLALGTLPLTCQIPSGILLFWTTSNVIAIARVSILQNSSVRNFLGIPTTEQVRALHWLPKPSHQQNQYDVFYYRFWHQSFFSPQFHPPQLSLKPKSSGEVEPLGNESNDSSLNPNVNVKVKP